MSSGLLPNGPFPNVATGWNGGGSAGGTTSGVINSGTAWGTPFNSWINGVTGGTFTINNYFADTTGVTSNSRLFVSFKSDSYPADFTFDTPVGSTTPVGRVMYTDMHLASGTPSGTFPGNCPTQGSDLTNQEDAAEYLLFELGSCVSGSPVVGPPTQFFPATFTRDFQASCQNGFRPVWHLFSYEDTTGSDSNITFTAFTADSEAQLGTEYPQNTTVAVASGANACPNGPSCSTAFVSVDVDSKLLLASGGRPRLRHPAVRVALVATGEHDARPVDRQVPRPTSSRHRRTTACRTSEPR